MTLHPTSRPRQTWCKKNREILGLDCGAIPGNLVGGFQTGFSLFFIFFIRLEGRRSWPVALSFSVVAVFLFIFLYGEIFGACWPEGLLETYIGLSF